MIRLRHALLTLVAALATAAPASAAVAPGLVTFPLNAAATVNSVDVFAPSTGVALPDGGAVLVGVDRGKGLVLAQLRADGSLDPRFGTNGISHVAVPFPQGFIGAIPMQLLRRPDGRLLAVYEGASTSKYEGQHLVVAGLTADGRLDPSYGGNGIADPAVQQGCGGGCSPAALAPDGSLLLTGATGQVSPEIEHNPNAPRDFTWVVARLTPTGALDRSYGENGLAKVAGGDGHGYSLALFGDGAVATTGVNGRDALVARLTPSGALDPSFHGGTPAPVSGSTFTPAVLARADGTADVLASSSGSASVQRYSRTGDVVGTFAVDAGSFPPALTAAPDGTELVTWGESVQAGSGAAALHITRLNSDGSIGQQARVALPFGGGLASVFARIRPVLVMPLNQTGYRAGTPIVRPDGKLLFPGGIGVIQYTGEGEGVMHEEEAATLLTSGLGLDPSFGGAARAARISLRVPSQHAALDARRSTLRVAVDATTSGPGLALLEVRAGKRVLARSTAAVYRTGKQRLGAYLTVTGRSYLKHHRRVRVSVSATFRDLVGAQAKARTAHGTLR